MPSAIFLDGASTPPLPRRGVRLSPDLPCVQATRLQPSSFIDESEDLGFGRHGIGATVTGHDNRAAGIAHPGSTPPIPSFEIAINETAGEGVTRAEYVQYFYRKRIGV